MSSIIKANEIQNSSGGADVKIQTLKHPSSSSNNLVLGSDGSATINQISSSTVFPAGGTGNPISVAVICDQKSYNSPGGTSSVGWNDRELNTVISDTEGANGTVTVSSNQFTLGAGTYLINWIVPAYRSERTFSKLYDVTGSQDLQLSKVSYVKDVYMVFTDVHGKYIHTISANNTYKIQQYFENSLPTYGLGVETNVSGYNSIYSMVYIYKLK